MIRPNSSDVTKKLKTKDLRPRIGETVAGTKKESKSIKLRNPFRIHQAHTEPIKGTNGRAKGIQHTEFGDEEKEHDDGGDDCDDAAGEGPAVEILVDLGVSVQVA